MKLETTPNELLHHFGYENAEIRSMAWIEKP